MSPAYRFGRHSLCAAIFVLSFCTLNSNFGAANWPTLPPVHQIVPPIFPPTYPPFLFVCVFAELRPRGLLQSRQDPDQEEQELENETFHSSGRQLYAPGPRGGGLRVCHRGGRAGVLHSRR